MPRRQKFKVGIGPVGIGPVVSESGGSARAASRHASQREACHLELGHCHWPEKYFKSVLDWRYWGSRQQKQMEKAVKSKFSVPWIYWVCVGTTLFVVIVSAACAFFSENVKGRRADLLGTAIVLIVTLGFALWPILRSREPTAPQRKFVHFFSLHTEAVVFPMSRVKQFILVGGGIFLFVGVALVVVFGNGKPDQTEVVIAIAFLLFAVFFGITSLSGGKKGIFLVSTGIIWNEMFGSPCFIPWEIVGESSIRQIPGRDAPKVWAFRLNVSEPERVDTDRRTRKKLVKSKSRRGWHFSFFQETILVPLDSVARTIEFYREHPEARGEIGTASSLARIESLNDE